MSTSDWINLLKVFAAVGVPVAGGVLAMWWRLSAVVTEIRNVGEQLKAIWDEIKGKPCADHEARIAVMEEKEKRVDHQVARLESIRFCRYPASPLCEGGDDL